MRKVVLGLGISLDGYIARPDGAVDFLFMPKDYSMAPFFATVDTAIMGRKTLDAGLNWAEDERRCHIRTCRCMYSPRRNHLVNETASSSSTKRLPASSANSAGAGQRYLADGWRGSWPGSFSRRIWSMGFGLVSFRFCLGTASFFFRAGFPGAISR